MSELKSIQISEVKLSEVGATFSTDYDAFVVKAYLSGKTVLKMDHRTIIAAYKL